MRVGSAAAQDSAQAAASEPSRLLHGERGALDAEPGGQRSRAAAERPPVAAAARDRSGRLVRRRDERRAAQLSAQFDRLPHGLVGQRRLAQRERQAAAGAAARPIRRADDAAAATAAHVRHLPS